MGGGEGEVPQPENKRRRKTITSGSDAARVSQHGGRDLNIMKGCVLLSLLVCIVRVYSAALEVVESRNLDSLSGFYLV